MKAEISDRLESYIQLVQKILSEEFREPPVNFRKLSEKIIKKLLLRAGFTV